VLDTPEFFYIFSFLLFALGRTYNKAMGAAGLTHGKQLTNADILQLATQTNKFV
jgi:hypothetical protein